MPTDIARYSIELFKPGGEGAGIEEILDRHADLKIARSIYRTRVEEYPGRLIMLCDHARCWPEAISRSHDSSGLLVTTISDVQARIYYGNTTSADESLLAMLSQLIDLPFVPLKLKSHVRAGVACLGRTSCLTPGTSIQNGVM